MIRRLNYTGRIKLQRNRIDVALLKDSEGPYFQASIDLKGLKLPPNAKVYVEPNFKGFYQRFSFGTVEQLSAPKDTRLNELPDSDIVYFDVSVVDEQYKTGLLLAKAKGIVASTNGIPNDRIPLLYVNPVDLKNQFWRLTFDSSDDGRPILEINKNIPDIFEMARNDIKFISLVYPAVFRGVLIKLIEDGDFDFEEDSWMSQWVKFLKTVLGIKILPEIDGDSDTITSEQEAWVEECVNEYCKKLRLFEKFIAQ